LIIGNCQLSDRIIRASEIGQYDFCAKAWWLGSIEGVPPSNIQQLQAGTAAHEEHGRQVRRASQLQVVAFTLMGLGVIILLLALFVR
jgi:CRISPR/Cas system-associated exonuclease Cas4 (RecB family)